MGLGIWRYYMMKRYWTKHVFKSNCLLTGIILSIRLRSLPIFSNTFKDGGVFHVHVITNGYKIDFHPFDDDLPRWKQCLIFDGTLRIRKLK